MISVIVPVFNVENYLNRCIDSILNQTYKNFELIIVDDGSFDHSPSICDVYKNKDSRVKVIHKSNGGLSDARNSGLDIAKGKYIFFVDSDDWLEEDALEYLYILIKKYNADFAFAENNRSEIKRKIRQPKEIKENLWDQKTFLKKFFKINTQINVQYAWAKLYKKELFDNVRYPVGVTNEDIPSTFQIALSSRRIVHSNKIIYNYFYNNNSITTHKFSEERLDLLKVWDLVNEYAKYDQCNDWIRKNAKLCRYRANFGWLTNLALADIPLKKKQIFLNNNKKILNDFKQEYPTLMNAQLPISRKLLMSCYNLNYKFSLYMLHFLVRLRSE